MDEILSDGVGEVEKDGLAAVVVTAGPPGAGKSTLLDGMDIAGPGWRRIDADDIKVKLLEVAMNDGSFDQLFARNLSDGYPIMMNELSSLVHRESVFLADRLIERCLESRENVIIEGTLSWSGLPRRYLRDFEQNDYSSVTILDVEVDQATALEQAFNRWATGRHEAIQGAANGGGRFTPREAITSIYGADSRVSSCNKNAVDFFNDPGAESFDDLKLIVYNGQSQEYRRVVGTYLTPVPSYL
ncbi:zeta toxin family protein [Glutamicibacter soli]